MTAKVINDPAALGWEFDPDTGRWTWGGSSGGGGTPFPEAPLDGSQYGRQDAGWTEIIHPDDGGPATITTANVLLENPTRLPDGMVNQQDANSYIAESLDKLIDGDGNVIKGGIEEAPSDSSIYGRKNEGWVVVPTGGGGGDVDLSGYYTAVQCDSKYEPKFTKNTAFNKNFGSSSGTVAQGNHNHAGVYEPVFSKNTAFNKNFGSSNGTVAQGNHNHTGVYQPAGDYALKSYSYSKGESDAKYALKGASGATPSLDQVTKVGSTSSASITAPNFYTGVGAFTIGQSLNSGPRMIFSGGWNFVGSTTTSYVMQISNAGKLTAPTFGTKNQVAGKKFNVSANGHIDATSLTSASNLAGTHGTCTFIFGAGFGDAPGNVSATSTVATGTYTATWATPGNFYAGQLAILGTGAVSDFYAYSINTASSGFFEYASIWTFENNIKGKQISWMLGAMVPSNKNTNPGRLTEEQKRQYDEYIEKFEAASKLEVCGGGHGTIYAEPNDLGLITIHTPYLSDHSAAIAGVKDMVKANRSELPASILLHNGFRLDGKKIILDLDAARANVEEQITNTLSALLIKYQSKALLTGDERAVAICRELYAASVKQIKKGNAAELTRMLTALSDMSAEFIPLRSL